MAISSCPANLRVFPQLYFGDLKTSHEIRASIEDTGSYIENFVFISDTLIAVTLIQDRISLVDTSGAVYYEKSILDIIQSEECVESPRTNSLATFKLGETESLAIRTLEVDQDNERIFVGFDKNMSRVGLLVLGLAEDR